MPGQGEGKSAIGPKVQDKDEDKATFLNMKDKSVLSNVTPIIAPMKETTSDFTRSKNPSTRYWKTKVEFRRGDKLYPTARVEGVRVPLVDDKSGRYGTEGGYLYAGLGLDIRDGILEMLNKKVSNVVVDDPSLVKENVYWWKTVSIPKDSIGIVDATAQCHFVNPREVMDKTGGGMILAMEFSAVLKASKDKNDGDLTQTDKHVLHLELVRGYVSEVMPGIEPPIRAALAVQKKETKPTVRDVCSESTLKLLSDLKIF